MTTTEFSAARRQLWRTQTEAAAALGYSHPQAISDLETGKRQVSATLALLVRAYLDGWRPERADTPAA